MSKEIKPCMNENCVDNSKISTITPWDANEKSIGDGDILNVFLIAPNTPTRPPRSHGSRLILMSMSRGVLRLEQLRESMKLRVRLGMIVCRWVAVQ